MENIELISVGELLKNYHFNIPSYQRGYRWKEKQVEQLIDDIDSFVPTEKQPFYFLQALAVSEKGGKYNVVDGQQRLTTLNLLLGGETIGEKGEIVSPQKQEDETIEIEYDLGANQAIDKFYKKEAIIFIETRLGGGDDNRRKDFCKKVKERCKFLLYRVEQEDESYTFTSLNSGKIPAKDSELVKCVLLSPGVDEPAAVTSARAKEWDEMERRLNDEDFFAWITPKNAWKENDRMTVLLRYAGIKAQASEEVFPFLAKVASELKKLSRETLWANICAAYYRLVDWYNDSLMYHVLGAYVHRKGNAEIPDLTKLDLNHEIKEMSKYMSDYTPSKDRDDYNNGQNDALYHYLLLANVAFCWKRWPMKYSFVRHRAVSGWSLEHIFARNQRDLDEKDFEAWGLNEKEIKFYKQKCEDGEGNVWLSEKFGENYPPENEDNSIGNLAMLPRDANSSLNNSLFEGKRNSIREWANAGWDSYWVPPMTEAVFMKTLNRLKVGNLYWSKDDKNAYIEEMGEYIQAFMDALNNRL